MTCRVACALVAIPVASLAGGVGGGLDQRLAVVPPYIVDKVRALVLGLGCQKLQIEGGLSWHILEPG